MTVIFWTCLLAGCGGGADRAPGFAFKVHHFGVAGQPEWEEFARSTPAGRDFAIAFEADPGEDEQTLFVWQDNVKQTWTVNLNGKALGKLQLYEIPVITAFRVPAALLVKGTNQLSFVPPKEPDDIRVGVMPIDRRPLPEILSRSSIEVQVVEPLTGEGVPCRITIVDETYEALPAIAAAPDQKLAVRPGCVYTPDGRAHILVPPGRYRVTAGRGFEYSIDMRRVDVRMGEMQPVKLKIRREVPTANLVACDPHVHTLSYSGHGDSTLDERMITLAGEGIELPVATEHNQHSSYAEAAVRSGLRGRFTPVLGNEVTTATGHFNVFPVEPGSPVPDWKVKEWPKLMESIRAVPGVRTVILNHPRGRHSNFVPFADEHFNRVTGENRRGFEFTFDAMEIVNSGALRSDTLEIFRDWFALLNYGYKVAGVGSSDGHDVNRYIVGQGRTYISCKDGDPGKIDVEEACRSLNQGRALISLGLLTQMTVAGRFRPGDLATGLGKDLELEISVLGPSWTQADQLTLYANGAAIREEKIGGAAGGEKAKIRWRIPKPPYDVHLVAVATGPGVRDLHWPLARPYQPDSKVWTPRVVGATNPIWIDGDGDGSYAAPRVLAKKLVDVHADDPAGLIAAISAGDEAIAAQTASLLHARGKDVRSADYASAPEKVRRGFEAFISTLK